MDYDIDKLTSDCKESILLTMPETKSWVKFGDTYFSNSRRFNWFQRKLWKYLLGVEIANVKRSK